MLRLRTLGGLSLGGAQREPTSAALQRKRLALLATIGAVGPEASMSRDRLLLLFWPDRDTDSARHALAQSLHALRRGLGEDELFLGTHDIRLNPAVVRVDLWDFTEAAVAGDLERAAGVYGGPFLDGIHLTDAPEFERWADAERASLARRHADVLGELARQADARGDPAAAVKWWRALAAADPLAARPALGLMRALAAAGETAAALQHARVYVAMLRTDLEVEPDPEIAALEDRLRRSLSSGTPSTGARTVDATERIATPADVPISTAPPTEQSGAPDREQDARQRPRIVGPRAAAAGLLTLVAALVLIDLSSRASADDQTGAPNRIIVLPFAVHGSDRYEHLREGMVELLVAALDGAGDVRAIDPGAQVPTPVVDATTRASRRAASVARELDARYFVVGHVTEAGEQLQLASALYEASRPTDPLASAAATAHPDHLLEAVDRLAAQLLAAHDARRAGPATARITGVAAVTTESLTAFRAFLAGEQAYRVGNSTQALAAFERAVTVDTTFALGYYRLSFAADWLGRTTLARDAAAHAARHGTHLPEHDRLLLQALLAWRRGDADAAERIYRAVTQRHPDDLEGWYQLGEVLFHENPPRGRSFLEAREPFERALALAPDRLEPSAHLLRIAMWLGRREDARRYLQDVDPAGTHPGYMPFRAIVNNDDAELRRALESLDATEAHALHAVATLLASYTRRLDVAAAVLELATHPRRSRDERMLAHRGLQQIAAARGRLREARAHADTLRMLEASAGTEAQAQLALIPLVSSAPETLLALREGLLELRHTTPPAPIDSARAPARSAEEHWAMFTMLAGAVSARMGDAEGARNASEQLHRFARRLADSSAAWRRERATWLRAAALAADGRPIDALSTLQYRADSTRPATWAERYLLAELLRDAGRQAEAVRWFGAFEHMGLEALPWAAAAHVARGRLLAARGDRAEAKEAYARFMQLYRDADVEMEALALEAQEVLAPTGPP